MAQERSGENQEKTKASRGILATDGSGAANMAAECGRSERHNSSLYVHIDPKFRILFGKFFDKPRMILANVERMMKNGPRKIKRKPGED